MEKIDQGIFRRDFSQPAMEKASDMLEFLVEMIIKVYLRNKSWNPECVGSFNMDWGILVLYPEPEARNKIY